MMPKTDWIYFEIEDFPARRAYEGLALDELRERFAPRAEQHYVQFVKLMDPMGDDFCECMIHLDDYEGCYDYHIMHPSSCAEREPGDGIRACHLMWIIHDAGLEDIARDLGERGPGTYPLSLYVERSGGYWMPEEVDCYLLLEAHEEHERDEHSWLKLNS